MIYEPIDPPPCPHIQAMLQHVAMENHKQVPSFSQARFSTKTQMPVETLAARLSQLRENSSSSSRTSTNNTSTNLFSIGMVPTPIAKQVINSGSPLQSTEDLDVIMTTPTTAPLPSLPPPSSPPPVNSNNNVPVQFPPPSHYPLSPQPIHSYPPSLINSQSNLYLPSYNNTQPINSMSDPSYNHESYEIATVLSSMKFAML
jgi:hypothetical protein